MRIYTNENGDSTWAPIAIIMTVLVVALGLGYFLWYAPTQTAVVTPTHEVVVNAPAAPTPSAPTTVIIPPTQGAPGPAGAPGAPGKDGKDAAPAPDPSRSDNTPSSSDDSSKTGGSSTNSQ